MNLIDVFAVKPCEIRKIKNALVKPVFCVTEYSFRNRVSFVF